MPKSPIMYPAPLHSIKINVYCHGCGADLVCQLCEKRDNHYRVYTDIEVSPCPVCEKEAIDDAMKATDVVRMSE